MDEVVNLSQVPSQRWEETFSKHLWASMSDFIFDDSGLLPYMKWLDPDDTSLLDGGSPLAWRQR